MSRLGAKVCREKSHKTCVSQWSYLIRTCFAKRQLNSESVDGAQPLIKTLKIEEN